MHNKFVRQLTGFVLLAAVCFVAWGAYQRQERNKVKLPDGIVFGNGRIEAIQVDIATKYNGRISEVLAKEGDLVEPDQILCRMDTAELEASLEKAQAQHLKALEDIEQAAASVVQKEAAASLAQKSFARAELLKKKKAIADQEYDEQRSRRDSAEAEVNVAKAARRSAEQANSAAEAEVKRVRTQLDDMVLKSPVVGRVLYRLAEPGMVLAAGGKVLTVVDLSDIYMEIFLPAKDAAQARVGAQARILLDAAPEFAAQARVSFVSPEAQFTPKQVETRNERDKLMFRIKLQIPHELVLPFINRIKTGIRGVGYVRLDDAVAWPEFLERRFPRPQESSPSAAQVAPNGEDTAEVQPQPQDPAVQPGPAADTPPAADPAPASP